MAGPTQEYKSVYRAFPPGTEYEDCGEFLKSFLADGWDLFTVGWVKGVYQSEGFEVFYFRRAVSGPVSSSEPVIASATGSAGGTGKIG